MQKNFCVLLPLADWVMGTLVTEASLAKRKAEREAALAAGQSLAEPKRRPLRLFKKRAKAEV